MERDVRKVSTKWLKYRYGKANGLDREAEDELRRRGINSKELGKILWHHAQKEWQKQAKKGREIRRRKKRSARRAKTRQKRAQRRERHRQEQIDRVARLKQGVVIVGEHFDPSACDGSCPF